MRVVRALQKAGRGAEAQAAALGSSSENNGVLEVLAECPDVSELELTHFVIPTDSDIDGVVDKELLKMFGLPVPRKPWWKPW